MLSQELRPQDFDSIAGQKILKETLRAIVKNPTTSPRSIVLSGPYGTGKTTSSRVFAKALNCPNKDSKQNPCNKPTCPICSQDINTCTFYSEYDSSIVGNVETIRELRDTFHYTIKGLNRVIVLDECFDYCTPILVKHGDKVVYKDIGYIVNKGLNAEVACVDSQGNLTFKPIIGWHRLSCKENTLELTFRRSDTTCNSNIIKKIKCTEGHKLAINLNEYVKVKDLKVGDKVKGYFHTSDIGRLYSVSRKQSYYEVTEEVYQMMLGIALGNSELNKSFKEDTSRDKVYEGNARFRVCHSEKEQPYLKHLHYLFGDLASDLKIYKETSDTIKAKNDSIENFWSVSNINNFQTKSHKIFTEIYDITRESNNQRVISDTWLERITPLGLTYLYMDIGSFYKGHATLNMHSFYKKDMVKLQKYFKDTWDINFKIYKDKQVYNGLYEYDDSETSKGYFLSTSKRDDTTAFLSLVAPFIHKSMEYKLGGYFTAGNACSYTKPIKYNKKLVPNYQLVDYELVEVKQVTLDRNVVFDLTIEGNHNYFANNILAHNCQEASNKAQGALLKVLEEAPQGVFFIFATTHPHKLLPTILSRSLEIKLQGVSIADIQINIKNHLMNLGLEVDENIIRLISQKSKGHMRDAHMLLDLYSLLGKETFLDSIKSTRQPLIQYMLSIATKNKALLFKSMDELQTFPVADIQEDYEELLLDLTKALVDKDDSQLSKLAQALNINLLKIVKQSSEAWFTNSFKNDVSMTTAFLSLYQLITQSTVTTKTNNIRTK